MKRQKSALTRPPVTDKAARTSIGGEMESSKNKSVDADKSVLNDESDSVAGKPAASPPSSPSSPAALAAGSATAEPVSREAVAKPPAADSKPEPAKTAGPVKAIEPSKAGSDKIEGAKPDADKRLQAPPADKAAKDVPSATGDAASKATDSAKDVAAAKASSDGGKDVAMKPAGGGGGGKLPPQAPSEQQPGKGGRAALVLSLVALIAVAVLGWQIYELRQAAGEIRQEVAQRLSGSETATTEVRALVRQNNESLSALQGRFGAIESQVGAMEGQAATLELLYRESSRSRGDQVLAELEQAITIAGQQLQLAGNFEAALIALQGAEARLGAPEFGHLQPLRRALVRDIEALKAHPQVDVSGIALRLELVLERIDSLPLAFEVKLAELAAEREVEAERAREEQDTLGRVLGFARALGADIWGEVKGMVRLERLDIADPVLLGPEQSGYLRENVKIRLLTARLALLARDGRTYVTDIERARDWLERYFDGGSEQVRRTLDELAELAATPVRAELPTLTDTFAALRVLQARGAATEPLAPAEAGADEAAR